MPPRRPEKPASPPTAAARPPSLRDERDALVERRIGDAAVALLREGGELTFTEVARRSGVAERTLYRRFPTKAELERCAWASVSTGFGNERMPQTLDELVAQVRLVFRSFDRDARLVRSMLRSPEGMRVRLRANEERRAGFLAVVDDIAPSLPGTERARAAAALQVLYSAPTWEMLHDFWDLDGDAGAEVAITAIGHIARGLRQSTLERAPKPRRAKKEGPR